MHSAWSSLSHDELTDHRSSASPLAKVIGLVLHASHDPSRLTGICESGVLEMEVACGVLPFDRVKGYSSEAAPAKRAYRKVRWLTRYFLVMIPGGAKSTSVTDRVRMRFDKNGMHRGEDLLVNRAHLTTA
jgi:hypothetical protein